MRDDNDAKRKIEVLYRDVLGESAVLVERLEALVSEIREVEKGRALSDADLARLQETLARGEAAVAHRMQDCARTLTKEVKESASMAHEEDWRMLWQMYWMAAISVFMGLGTAFLNVSHLLWR